MDAGAVVANPNRHTPAEASALEYYYSEVARLRPEAVATEYDNDPPADESQQRVVLTAYHIQHNCLSGLEKREAPDETICITVGGDVQKLGLHWVAIAWNEQGAGSIIDYDFFSVSDREPQSRGLRVVDPRRSVRLVFCATGASLRHTRWRTANR